MQRGVAGVWLVLLAFLVAAGCAFGHGTLPTRGRFEAAPSQVVDAIVHSTAQVHATAPAGRTGYNNTLAPSTIGVQTRWDGWHSLRVANDRFNYQRIDVPPQTQYLSLYLQPQKPAVTLPGKVSVYLRAGGVPSPDSELYDAVMTSDDAAISRFIRNPLPGPWYLVFEGPHQWGNSAYRWLDTEAFYISFFFAVEQCPSRGLIGTTCDVPVETIVPSPSSDAPIVVDNVSASSDPSVPTEMYKIIPTFSGSVSISVSPATATIYARRKALASEQLVDYPPSATINVSLVSDSVPIYLFLVTNQTGVNYTLTVGHTPCPEYMIGPSCDSPFLLLDAGRSGGQALHRAWVTPGDSVALHAHQAVFFAFELGSMLPSQLQLHVQLLVGGSDATGYYRFGELPGRFDGEFDGELEMDGTPDLINWPPHGTVYVRVQANAEAAIVSLIAESHVCLWAPDGDDALVGECGGRGECGVWQRESSEVSVGLCQCRPRWFGEACDQERDSGGAWGGKLSLLTISNLAMVPACIVLWSKSPRFYLLELLALSFTSVWSLFYHLCDEVCVIWPYQTYWYLDHIMSNTAVFLVGIYLMDLPFWMKAPLQGAALVGAMLLSDLPVGWTVAVYVIGGGVIAARPCIAGRRFPNWNWRLVPGAGVAAIMVMLYFLIVNNDNYWLMHSMLWHVGIMAAAGFMLAAKNHDPDGKYYRSRTGRVFPGGATGSDHDPHAASPIVPPLQGYQAVRDGDSSAIESARTHGGTSSGASNGSSVATDATDSPVVAPIGPMFRDRSPEQQAADKPRSPPVTLPPLRLGSLKKKT